MGKKKRSNIRTIPTIENLETITTILADTERPERVFEFFVDYEFGFEVIESAESIRSRCNL